jgi:hypothetical protein
VPAYPRQIEGLTLTAVDDGFIIYETERDRVHYLNPTASLVLILCDGTNAAEEIPLLLQRQFDLPEPPEGEVADLLGQFVEEGLVVTEPTTG